MSEALITKLPSSVTDETLMKIDEIRLYVKIPQELSASLRYISVASFVNRKARIVGDGYFTDSTGTQNYGKTLEQASNNIYLSPGEYILFIGNKNEVLSVATSIDARDYIEVKVDFDFFERLPAVLNYTLYGFKCVDDGWTIPLSSIVSDVVETLVVGGDVMLAGDISDMKFLSSLKNFTAGVGALQSLPIIGDIESFNGSINLTTLSLTRTKITGNINNLLDGLFSNGKTSGTLSVNASGMSGVTYNGEQVLSSKSFTFTDSGWAEA